MDSKRALISAFEEDFWEIDAETKEQLYQQDAKSLVLKISEWMLFAKLGGRIVYGQDD